MSVSRGIFHDDYHSCLFCKENRGKGSCVSAYLCVFLIAENTNYSCCIPLSRLKSAWSAFVTHRVGPTWAGFLFVYLQWYNLVLVLLMDTELIVVCGSFQEIQYNIM